MGVDYTDDFTVTPSGTSVSVAGTGCSVASSTGSFTLTVSRADAGTRSCTVTADTAMASTTVTFTDPTPAPTIAGLGATGTSNPGTDYIDDFTVTPTTSTVLVSGAGCSLSGTAGSYTMTASRADAGTRTCTITAIDILSTTASATITFISPPAPSISGLDATGTATAGINYNDTFTVTPTSATVSPSGTGCSLSGSSGAYTLTVSRPDAGTRTCTVSADTASATATITFTAATPGQTPGLPMWTWVICSADGKLVTVGWEAGSGATGYEVREDGGDLATWSGTATSFTRASTPGEYYRWRVRSIGTGGAKSAWTGWSGGGCPNPPAIMDLPLSAKGMTGTDYTVEFSVTPVTITPTAAPVSTCLIASNPLTNGHILTVKGNGTGKFTRTCTITAGTVRATIKVAFSDDAIMDLPSSDTGETGRDYTVEFSVTPATTTPTAAPIGTCSIATDALTGGHTLTVKGNGTGKFTRSCTITAGTAKAIIKVTFISVPAAPTMQSCDQKVSDSSSPYEVTCWWSSVAGTVAFEFEVETESSGSWTGVEGDGVVRALGGTVSLAAGNYRARARAKAPNVGSWSDWLEFNVVPAAPSISSCVKSGTETTRPFSVTCRWSSIANTNIYELVVQRLNIGAWKDWYIHKPAETTHQFSLPPGLYQARVRVEKPTKSAWSNWTSLTITSPDIPSTCTTPPRTGISGVRNPKYCINSAESIIHEDNSIYTQELEVTLYRVIALRDIFIEDPQGRTVLQVARGDKGGWIESRNNLSHSGDSWVADTSKVFESASVYGDAQISGNPSIFGSAAVYGDAQISGSATIFGSAAVYGSASVSGGIVKGGTLRGHATMTSGTVQGSALIKGHARISGGTAKGGIICDYANISGGTVSGGSVGSGESCGDYVYSYGASITGGSVSGSAKVYGSATISGGKVSGSAKVYGNAMISESRSEIPTYIKGSAQVYGKASVYGGTIQGTALIYGNAYITNYLSHEFLYVLRGRIHGDAIIDGPAYIGAPTADEGGPPSVDISGSVVIVGGTIYGGTISGGLILKHSAFYSGTMSGGTLSGADIFGGTLSGGLLMSQYTDLVNTLFKRSALCKPSFNEYDVCTASISGSARVTSGSQVFDNAQISGTAELCGDYQAGGETRLSSGNHGNGSCTATVSDNISRVIACIGIARALVTLKAVAKQIRSCLTP